RTPETSGARLLRRQLGPAVAGSRLSDHRERPHSAPSRRVTPSARCDVDTVVRRSPSDRPRASRGALSGPTRRPAPSTPPSCRRADRRGASDAGLGIRLGVMDRLCETLVSWRLLLAGCSPWLRHRSYSTTSAEPPHSNFNSYRDIPQTRGER